MHAADAFEHLAHQRRLGGVRETLTDMPLGERRQAQPEGVQGQVASVLGQVASDAVAGCRQEAAPAHLKVFDGGPIAASGVVPDARLQIALDLAHALSCRPALGQMRPGNALSCDKPPLSYLKIPFSIARFVAILVCIYVLRKPLRNNRSNRWHAAASIGRWCKRQGTPCSHAASTRASTPSVSSSAIPARRPPFIATSRNWRGAASGCPSNPACRSAPD